MMEPSSGRELASCSCCHRKYRCLNVSSDSVDMDPMLPCFDRTAFFFARPGLGSLKLCLLAVPGAVAIVGGNLRLPEEKLDLGDTNARPWLDYWDTGRSDRLGEIARCYGFPRYMLELWGGMGGCSAMSGLSEG